MEVDGNMAFPALVFTNHLRVPDPRAWAKEGCSQYLWLRSLYIISLLNFHGHGNRFPDYPPAWQVSSSLGERYLCLSQSWSMPHSSRRCCCLMIRPLTWVQFPTQNQTDNLLVSVLLRWFIQPAAWQYFEEQLLPSCFGRSLFLLSKWAATSKIQPSPSLHAYTSVLPANLPLDLFHPSCPNTK